MKTSDTSSDVAYAQAWADLLACYWEWSRIYFESGDFFVIEKRTKNSEFSAVAPLKVSTQSLASHRRDPLRLFHSATQLTLKSAFLEFFTGERIFPSRDPVVYRKKEELRQSIVGDPYFQWLSMRVRTLGIPHSRAQIELGQDFIGQIGSAGINTAALASSQLLGIFGENFLEETALILSRVSLEKLGVTLLHLGITAFGNEIIRGKPTEHLIDLSNKHGLNKERLTELGYGSAVGCPAGRPPSKQCLEFLREKLAVVEREPSKQPMLLGVEGWLKQEFENHVLKWFNDLDEEGRREGLSLAARELLEYPQRPMTEGSRCPHNKER